MNGEPIKDCESYLASDCPEDTGIVLGNVGMAEPRHLELAMTSLREGFEQWRDTDWEIRTGLLFDVAY